MPIFPAILYNFLVRALPRLDITYPLSKTRTIPASTALPLGTDTEASLSPALKCQPNGVPGYPTYPNFIYQKNKIGKIWFISPTNKQNDPPDPPTHRTFKRIYPFLKVVLTSRKIIQTTKAIKTASKLFYLRIRGIPVVVPTTLIILFNSFFLVL